MRYNNSLKTTFTSHFNVYVSHSSIDYVIYVNLYLNGEKL